MTRVPVIPNPEVLPVRIVVLIGALVLPATALSAEPAGDSSPLIRSAQNGPWSAAATWEGGRVPGPGARVQVRAGHTVTYDLEPKVAARVGRVVRSIHAAGTLT